MWLRGNMEISLLADHPHEAPKIAKWYYDEWARLAPNVTEEIVLEKVIEKSVNREEIPLSLVAHLVPFPFNSDRLSYQSNGSSFTSITTLILLLTPASFVINPRSSSFNNI